jgi:hypothetical protein
MLGYHRADPAVVWNGGIGFSRCLGCGTDIVRRSGARWARVPRGYAVIWRPVAERPALVGSVAAKPGRAMSLARLSNGMRRMATMTGRALDRLHLPAGHAPTDHASRGYRYLARRMGNARTIVVSGLCESAAANDALLLLAAMLQDERGGRLLLIDATLGDTGVGAVLGAGGKPGLSDVRADEPWSAVEAMRMLARPDMILLGAGRRPATGRPDHIAAMLPFLAERFDHIIIQQRGIMDDSRNLALANCADLIWVVAEEGRSPMARITQARDAFRAHGIANVGLVLTVPSVADTRGG